MSFTFPHIFFFFTFPLCTASELLVEGADIFRSLMEGTENVISAPLLARHVVGERSAKRIGGCWGNEEKGTTHEKPLMHYNAGLG